MKGEANASIFALCHQAHTQAKRTRVGERQRVARQGLVERPDSSSPTTDGSLDPKTPEGLRRLSAFHQAGGTVIVVTHGSAAEEFADRTVNLKTPVRNFFPSCSSPLGAGQPFGLADPPGRRSRSGVTEERLELPMRSAWTHYPLHPPRPAWRGPAKRDPYNKVNDLKNRQLFDHAFHVVADARSVYFGSSADDQLHCLDATNGKGRWSYFTEGPVRLAPTLHDGKLFFGSDDGHAYCLNTKGGLVWRRRLAPEPHRIAGNNRGIGRRSARASTRDGVATRCGHVPQ